MAGYAIVGQQATVSSSYKTAIIVTANSAGTIRRGKVYDINCAAGSAPASTDTNIQFDLSRQTAAGTTTSYTPVSLDPADAAFSGLAGVNATVEGTITASSSVFNLGMNQRAPYRWQTYLGSGAELVYPATASNGFALRVLSAGYTGVAGGTIMVSEQ